MLAKKDLEQIRGAVKEEIDVAFEDFAIIVNKGFEQTASKNEFHEIKGGIGGVKGEINEVKEGLRAMNTKLDHQSSQLSSNSLDLQDLKENKITHFEFEDLSGRVKYLETKSGVESGK